MKTISFTPELHKANDSGVEYPYMRWNFMETHFLATSPKKIYKRKTVLKKLIESQWLLDLHTTAGSQNLLLSGSLVWLNYWNRTYFVRDFLDIVSSPLTEGYLIPCGPQIGCPYLIMRGVQSREVWKKNVLSGKERSPGRRFGGRLQEVFAIGCWLYIYLYPSCDSFMS